jgi:hypothetical protein
MAPVAVSEELLHAFDFGIHLHGDAMQSLFDEAALRRLEKVKARVTLCRGRTAQRGCEENGNERQSLSNRAHGSTP